MQLNSYSSKEKRFFHLAKEIAGEDPPTPLRRVFSLLRVLQEVLDKDDIWIVHNETTFDPSCTTEDCGQRKDSCHNYEQELEHYDYELITKRCHKLLFFKSEVKKGEETECNNDDIIGYCIVHHDTLKNIGKGDDKGKEYDRSYLTECVFQFPLPRTIKGYAYGNYNTEIKIKDRSYKVNGNYFSQQNSITNCCAQAAIKMALRAYYPDITCEKINDHVPIFHKKKEGNKGLNPKQIKTAIENFTNNQLTVYLLNANDLSYSHDFLKVVYLALESKMPVILLFHNRDKPIGKVSQGHAVTLIGHTFKQHTWGAYGGAHFSESGVGYLSSSLWCDSFVIQDDNLGPFYQMPSRFLTDYVEFSRLRDSYEKHMMVRTPLQSKQWYKDPLYALFLFPKDLDFMKDTYSIEYTAVAMLNKHVNELAFDGELPSQDDFHTYFYDNFKINMENREATLISRTLLVQKNEYLTPQIQQLYKRNGYLDLVEEILPDYFWISEISVPELYWINHAKVGEIIIDPKRLSESQYESVILIRLPYILTFFEESTEYQWDYPIQQDEPYHDIIKKSKGLLRYI